MPSEDGDLLKAARAAASGDPNAMAEAVRASLGMTEPGAAAFTPPGVAGFGELFTESDEQGHDADI